MIQHDLSHIKLDIGGPKGNVYYVLGACKNLITKLEGHEAGDSFIDMATGTPWKELGGESWNYNDVLRYIKDKLGITFVSRHKLSGVDKDLYELSDELNVWL
tara:strand:+ start:330 stop:635 length:306 start_codon:yes stop_codon:yes gene_type:complete